jgi:hypothetical protein
VTAFRGTPGERLHAPSDSDAGSIGATVGLQVERRPRADVLGDVGDVDPDPEALLGSLRRNGIVEVSRARGIDRERRQVGQVHSAPLGGRRCAGGVGSLGIYGRRELGVHATVNEQGVDDIAGAVG